MTQLAFGTSPFCLPPPPRPSPRLMPMAAAPSGVTTMEGERQASNGTAGTRHSPDAAAAAAPTAARSFVRRHLLTLAPYTPIEPFEVLSARLGRSTDDIIKLDANENPYGPPPDVLAALGSMAFPNIYPDPANRRLRDAIAARSGVPAEHLLVSGRWSLAGRTLARALVGAASRCHPGASAWHRAICWPVTHWCHGASHMLTSIRSSPPQQYGQAATSQACACKPRGCMRAAQVGCGADELIDLLMRCVLDPGDAIVDCPPTFTMYVFDADVNDARVVTVPRLNVFRLDVEGERRLERHLSYVVHRV